MNIIQSLLNFPLRQRVCDGTGMLPVEICGGVQFADRFSPQK